jgi:hypothetical protein
VRYKKAGKDQKKKLGGNGKHCDAAWEWIWQSVGHKEVLEYFIARASAIRDRCEPPQWFLLFCSDSHGIPLKSTQIPYQALQMICHPCSCWLVIWQVVRTGDPYLTITHNITFWQVVRTSGLDLTITHLLNFQPSPQNLGTGGSSFVRILNCELPAIFLMWYKHLSKWLREFPISPSVAS